MMQDPRRRRWRHRPGWARPTTCLLLVYTLLLGCQSLRFPEEPATDEAPPDAALNPSATGDGADQSGAVPNLGWTAHSRSGREAMRIRDLEEAERQFLLALEATEGLPPYDVRSRAAVGNLVRLAELHQARRDWEQSFRIIGLVLDAQESGREVTFDEAGILLERQARHLESEAQYLDAIVLHRAAIGLDPEGRSATKLIHLRTRIARNYEAESLFDQAGVEYAMILAELEQDPLADPVLLGALHFDLGHMLQLAERFDEAADQYAEALAIFEAQAPEGVEVSHAKSALAYVRAELGEHEVARGLAQSAVDGYDANEHGGSNLVDALSTLAASEAVLGETDAAGAHYARAVEILDGLDEAQRASRGRIYLDYASLLRDQGQGAEARAVEKRATARDEPPASQ